MGGMDWIEMAWDRDRWRALVNAVMKLRVLALLGARHILHVSGVRVKIDIQEVGCGVYGLDRDGLG